jgi:hypothetical protein
MKAKEEDITGARKLRKNITATSRELSRFNESLPPRLVASNRMMIWILK